MLGRSRGSPRQGPEMEIPGGGTWAILAGPRNGNPGGGTWAILETVVEFGTYPPPPFPINGFSAGFLVLLGRSRGSPRQGPEMEIPGGVRGPSSRQSSNSGRTPPYLFQLTVSRRVFWCCWEDPGDRHGRAQKWKSRGGVRGPSSRQSSNSGRTPPHLFQLTVSRRVFWCCWEDPGDRHGRAQKWKSRGGYVGHPRDSRRIRDVPPPHLFQLTVSV